MVQTVEGNKRQQ